MKTMGFPKELTELRQWVSWHTEVRGAKKTKVLLKADGSYAKSNDPTTWDSYENVKKRKHEGIGFVFLKDIVGIDLDYAFYTTGERKGQLKPFAKKTLDRFDSYTEYSPSRINGVPKGLHIIFKSETSFDGLKYVLDQKLRSEKETEEAIECYMSGRFFTVTENVYENRKELKTIEPEKITSWLNAIRKHRETPIPSPFNVLLPSDTEILAKIRLSRNGVKFSALYDQGNWQGLGFGSQSEADLSLSGSLMFFCRNDLIVADRLFKSSRLYRPKWDERHGKETYGLLTLRKATRQQVMNWLDPTCDDPSDMLQSIKLFGAIQIEKTDIGYIARTQVRDGEVIFTFTEIDISRQSVEVILEVVVDRVGEGVSSPYSLRIDIRSNSAQEGLVTRLNKAFGDEKRGGYNWTLITNNIFTALGQRIAAEQKVVYLTGRLYEEPQFLMYPFLQEKADNMFFSQPETGKSWLALRIAVSLSLGIPLFSYEAKGGHKTLFIDYEDNEQIFASRLHRICEGLGVSYNEAAKNIAYTNLNGSVRDNIEVLRKNIADEHISLAVFDAGGDAAGGSPNDEQKVIDLFNALRTLPCARLILHHEPKTTDGIANENAYYGTMYWRGRSRVAWRLVKEHTEDAGTLVKLILSKKSNLGSIEPLYYRLLHETVIDAQWENRTIPKTTMELAQKPVEEDTFDDKSVLSAIGIEGASPSQILGITGMPRPTLYRHLKALKMKSLIFEKKEGKNVRWYKNMA